jgi:outer membrane protein TolC
MPGSRLSLDEAIARGLEHHLGILRGQNAIDQARGHQRVARSALLPSVLADASATRQTINLNALGIQFESPIPGFSLPGVVGPFGQVDLRARLSQRLFDLPALNTLRAAQASSLASELTARDVRDVVVLAVGGSYLQTLAARARVSAARTELETATALLEQAEERRAVGLVAQVDVDRSKVQALTQQQLLIGFENEFAKQKIALARLIGAVPTDAYDLSSDVPFSETDQVDVEALLRRARERRVALRAAEAQVHAAERALAAARASRLPTAAVNADYGAIGRSPAEARRTFAVVGTVRVPLWQGGRIEGQIRQAEAALSDRQAELDDLAARVDGEIRSAWLDVRSSANQVEVARQNVEVARETLDLTRQRFEAGVGDNIEVVQAQESVSTATFGLINSVFAHNLAKLTLSRALGDAADRWAELLKVP